MTDEEMAEEYAKGLCKTCTLDTCRNNTLHTCAIKEYIKQAYLAGLKAGKLKWHKVADGDLPKEPEFLKSHPDNHRYEWFLVATVGKPDKALYSFAKKKWFIDYEEMMLGDSCFKPIAWCEIPQYTEE